eukprot:1646992-Prymnesium_polylepis.1
MDPAADRPASTTPAPTRMHYASDGFAGVRAAVTARRLRSRARKSLHQSPFDSLASRERAQQGHLILAGLSAADGL